MNRDSSHILCPDLNLLWTNKFTSFGIIYDVKDLDKIPALNVEPNFLEKTYQNMAIQEFNINMEKLSYLIVYSFLNVYISCCPFQVQKKHLSR